MIDIYTDEIVEYDETFMVHLRTLDSTSMDNATVIIKDNDGRPLLLITQLIFDQISSALSVNRRYAVHRYFHLKPRRETTSQCI